MNNPIRYKRENATPRLFPDPQSKMKKAFDISDTIETLASPPEEKEEEDEDSDGVSRNIDPDYPEHFVLI